MKSLMTYITALIFVALMVIPMLLLNETETVFEEYHSVEYNLGWKTPVKNDPVNMETELDSESEIFEKELVLENWMLEPLEWDIE